MSCNPCAPVNRCRLRNERIRSLLMPLSSVGVHQPYYKDSDMEHHYPNLYDFRRAAIFNQPQPMSVPYCTPIKLPVPDNYRKTKDWLSEWGCQSVRHMNAFPARQPCMKCCKCKCP